MTHQSKATPVSDAMVEAERIIDAYRPLGMPQLLPPQSHEAGLKRVAQALEAARTPVSKAPVAETLRHIRALVSGAGYDPAQALTEIDRRAADTLVNAKPVAEDDETYEIGKRDGYEKAVQDIDLLTGGDGEYRYCTGGPNERHCPDADTMKQRIAERFAMVNASPTSGEQR